MNFDTALNSSTGGVIIITIANPAVDVTHTVSVPCRSCLVQQLSGVQAYMDIETAAATATGWKLSATTPIPVPIDDIIKLHFIGTAADKIQILWRN